MNSTHDLGGMHGFGPIDRSQVDNFNQQWEEKVFGLTLACGMLGKWNLDQSRFAREQMHPGEYLQSSYYEHWLHGLELLLVEHGLVTREELNEGNPATRGELNAVPAEKVQGILKQGASTQLESERAPVFQTGDTVQVRNFNPRTHTRAPRYIRGCNGVVSAHYGAHIFPDQHAANGTKLSAHLYSVRFEAGELWGSTHGEERSAVYVDVFESYLEDGHGRD